MDIIVYDFDKTIYGGETGTDFLVFYMKKNPKKIFLFSIGFVKDALLFMQEKYKESLPSLITFATGPSRTADIEKTLVVGVHGPKEVYVFLVDEINNNKI